MAQINLFKHNSARVPIKDNTVSEYLDNIFVTKAVLEW